MKQFLLGAAALSTLALPAAAFASDGWYGSAAIGGGTTQDIELTGPGASGDIQSQGHIVPQLGIGYGFENSGFRAELEVGHQYDETGAVGNLPFSDSDIQTYVGMLNVLYDFNEDSVIQPYAGAGVGIAHQRLSAIAPVTPAEQPPRVAFSGSDKTESLAFQGIAGLGYQISERLTADIKYRYMMIPEANFDSGGAEVQLDDFASHDVMFGIRYDFQPDAAPPPPPPPPPPPAPPPPPPAPEPAPTCEDVAFVVYFEWDQSFLTDQARGIISQAADRAAECGVASVTIEGHADRSGSASYNVGLSERRADAVEQELIAQGVAASSITTEAFGETQPAVETPDGVREPLNRRSEVVIRVTGATS